MINTLRRLLPNVELLSVQNIIIRYAFLLIFIILAITLYSLNQYFNDSLSSLSFGTESVINDSEVSAETSNIITVKKGDTLSAILAKENLSPQDVKNLINLAINEKIVANLKIGQEITFDYTINLVEDESSDLNSEQKILNRMSMNIDQTKSIEFIKEGDNFVVNYISSPLNKLVSKYEATIDNNVVSTLKKAGLSSNSIIELIEAYSYQIDFQRQIKSGDKITVITEKFVTPEGKLSHHGKIIYASISTQGQDYKIYRYSADESKNSYQFYTDEGKSIKSTLLKTPVKVVRISSHYGYRKKHPILGYGKMHLGADFAGPTGTPIHAAGSGVVSFIGWKSGYGKFIQIKHNNSLSTAYAHASRFASNLKKGSKVKQGDIIAFMGDTGATTGTHLHYEIHVNGKQVDPMKFKSTPGKELTGKELSKFNQFKLQILRLSKKLDGEVELAAEDITEIKLF